MARTPLLRALRKLAAEHSEAAVAGLDLGQVRERRAAALLGRRTFLRSAGAATAAAALSRPRWARATSNKPRIAILGAGISGLAAALQLQDSGFASTVYEASGRVGGRMHSNTSSWLNNQKSEWCGELIDSGHATLLGLIKRFGLTAVDEVAAEPANSTDTLYFKNAYYSQSQSDRDFVLVNNTLQAQIAAAPTTTYNSYNSLGYELDNTSVYAWIEKYVPNGHKSSLGRYLDSAYNQEYGLDTKLQSSLNLIYELGFQPTQGPGWNIYGVSDQRYSILGGNERLPLTIAAALPSGSIVTHCALTKIAMASGDAYKLTFATEQGVKTVVADEVILTIPFSVLRSLDFSEAGFTPLKHDAIHHLGYGTNSKLVLQFSEKYWDTKGPWGLGDGNIYTDLFFQNTWDSSRGIPGVSGVLTGYMGGGNGASFTATSSPYASAATDPAVVEYAKTFLRELEVVWPGVSKSWNGRATLSTPWRDPHLLGSYSCWKVGQYTTFGGYEGVRQANCHFAGEHCSLNYQGFMEGAAQEGIRAANEIVADY